MKKYIVLLLAITTTSVFAKYSKELEILGVKRNATENEIKKAYNAKTAKLFPGSPAYQQLTQAYDILRKSSYEYDRQYISIAELIKEQGQPQINGNVLDLQGKYINSLEGLNQIENLKSATTLNLSKNKLTLIQTRLIPDSVTTLDLSFNNILSVSPGVIPSSVIELNLRGNELRPLQKGVFNNLTKLKTLDISFIPPAPNAAEIKKNNPEMNQDATINVYPLPRK